MYPIRFTTSAVGNVEIETPLDKYFETLYFYRSVQADNMRAPHWTKQKQLTESAHELCMMEQALAIQQSWVEGDEQWRLYEQRRTSREIRKVVAVHTVSVYQASILANLNRNILKH